MLPEEQFHCSRSICPVVLGKQQKQIRATDETSQVVFQVDFIPIGGFNLISHTAHFHF